jgi:hypothetical protein
MADHSPTGSQARTPLVPSGTVRRPAGRPARDAAPRGVRAGSDWRGIVASLSGLNVLAGVWLIIAPWVLAYAADDPKWNAVVFGGVVTVFALTRVAGAFRESGLSLLNAVIGVWLFIAAFTIDSSQTAMWNDIILGVVVFLLGIASAAASEEKGASNTAV